eukprot:scaffold4214_cov172-Amphora_coffeaeformis.AAC.6
MHQGQKNAALLSSPVEGPSMPKQQTPDENFMTNVGRIGRGGSSGEAHAQRFEKQQSQTEGKTENSQHEDNIDSEHNNIAKEAQNSRTNELGSSIRNPRTPLQGKQKGRHVMGESTMECRKNHVEWDLKLKREQAGQSPPPQRTEAKHALDSKLEFFMAVKRRRRRREVQYKASDPEEQIKHDEPATKNTPINHLVPETERTTPNSKGKAGSLGNHHSHQRTVDLESMDEPAEQEKQKVNSLPPILRSIDVRLKAELHEQVRKRQRKMRQQRFSGLGEPVDIKETADDSQPIPPSHVMPAVVLNRSTIPPINGLDHAGLDQALADVQNAALVIQNAALSIQSAAGTLFETVAVLRNTIASNGRNAG